MECIFDENELVEYKSCERPTCNHVTCPEHEEYMGAYEANVVDGDDCPFTKVEL